MIELLSETVNDVIQRDPFRKKLAQRPPVDIEQVCLPAQSFVAACIAHFHRARSCWFVCADPKRQEDIFNGLINWGVEAIFFPDVETPAIAGALPDPELQAERLSVLQRITGGKRAVIVLTKDALSDAVPAMSELKQQTKTLQQGVELDLPELIAQLLASGYEQVPKVSLRGQFAVRGGIIDVFSPHHLIPVRIELVGDEIESIREFDLDEQTAIQVVSRCDILLAADGTSTVSVQDYLCRGDVLVAVEAELAEAAIRISRGSLKPGGEEDYSTAFYESFFHDFEAGDFLVEEHKRSRALEQLREWLAEKWRVVAVCHNEGEKERLQDVLRENEVETELTQFAVGSLNHGFTFPSGSLAVLTDAEIFGRYQSPSARRLALRRARLRGGRQPIDFADLAEGDLVVHLEHGIGQFRGIQKLGVSQSECVVLEYADGARLYVPLEQAFLISRYVGVGKRFPPLSALGDSRWAKAKRAAETAVFDYAAKLLTLQAERTSLPGFAFPPDTKWQKEFEASFLFQETVDQMQAIEDTKRDMESAQPMDRLICGDVGFGKTEVAIRAAFKSVMSGKQVAMLVPTTVLAQQHFQTFRERMSDYPIKVGMLSRFLSPAEQRKIVAEVQNGSIDIIIGTHRLISKDIEFKDLGLVIVDEEQRFGVRHKEKLKERFKLVDVLTLSATPIPRTLYLSLVGAKDMSTIETPPPNRLPIETVVAGYDERIIRDAINRELKRKGQVYFLHNRIQSIDHVRERVQTLSPAAQIDIGHGQMEEHELEEVMYRFVRGETDVLISTTIIESGLDIPNANTIIIDRADQFGLADLYQLRGRVGRAQQKAYAYLLLPRDFLTVGGARKRVNAIKQYSGLGAGFKIAMRDLEIRGAGNILGTAQSGHIINVGFDLYCQLLQQAVEKLKGKRSRSRFEVFIRLDFVSTNEADFLQSGSDLAPAFLPADYMAQPSDRIQAYKKLAETDTLERLRKLGAEWRDRFGPLPQAARNLLRLNEMRLVAGRAGVSGIEVKETKVMLTRGGDYILVGNRFPRLTSKDPESSLGELLDLIHRLS